MNRAVKIIVICLIGVLFLCLFLKKDAKENRYILDSANIKPNPDEVELNLDYPIPVTKTINGVDYLQSQLPIGKFGGEIVSSTIGEGPKTFNPFTSTDATSSTMADMMYDGLFTTNPMTGKVLPKLAKSIDIKGNHYIIHLRKGVIWSDGKPITADDVIFTWKDIIFAGLGNCPAVRPDLCAFHRNHIVQILVVFLCVKHIAGSDHCQGCVISDHEVAGVVIGV